MYASGSTLVFNAAIEAGRTVVPAANITGRYVVSAAELELTPDIAKIHVTDGAAAAALQQAADATCSPSETRATA